MTAEVQKTDTSEPPVQFSMWKKQRTITKTNADRELKKCCDLIDEEDYTETKDLVISRQKLVSYLHKLQQLDEQVIPYLKDTDIDAALADSDQREQQINDAVFRSDSLLRTKENAELAANPNRSDVNDRRSPTADSSVSAKLPKLLIQPFSGDALKWREFWDSFNVSVHTKDQLSSVEKFQYLKSFLRDDALRLIEGYSLTEQTYATAVVALEERYDHPEWCINVHLDSMIYMKECSNTVNDIQRTFDECEAHIRGLVALGLAEQTFERVFVPLILSKFPRFMRIELNRKNGTAAWTLTQLRKHLKDEIAARYLGLQTVGSSSERNAVDDKTNSFKKARGTYKTTAASLVCPVKPVRGNGERKEPKFPCAFCQRTGHYPEDCKRFTTASMRRSAMKQEQCLLCLSLNHRKWQCKSDKACRNCGAKRSHHHSLCFKKYGGDQKTSRSEHLNAEATSFTPAGSLVSASTIKNPSAELNPGISILGTARAIVRGDKGTERVRIILDNCSTRSFARIDVLKRVGAKLISEEQLGLAGLESQVRRYDKFGRYELGIICENGEQLTIAVNGLKTITCPVDIQPLSASQYPLLNQFPLSDSFNEHKEAVRLDIMIGLDQYYYFVSDIAVRLSDTLVLLDTKLGYVPNGSSRGVARHITNHDATTMLVIDQKTADDTMNHNLQRLWDLEDVGIHDAVAKPEDIIASEKFRNEISYDPEQKRYSVRWPWKETHPDLPTNYGLALGRLKALIRRLDPATLQRYDKTISEQLDKNIIEVAPQKPSGAAIHYIPHHCIIRPDHQTTKIRIVYDASAKTRKSESSLNERMYSGPALLEDLCGLLIRFRQHRVGIISDIEKAFLQIGIKHVDRDVTRFLWLKNVQLPAVPSIIVAFRFTRVLFGVTASPYMLAGTIRYHLSQLDSKISRQILQNCYVDNVITGTQSTCEAQSFYKEAKSIFRLASMNLREWSSNDQRFLNSIPPEDRGRNLAATVLGMHWNVSEDTLSCRSKLSSSANCTTKRDMLRSIAQLFDPCGYLAPVTILGKLLLQELWKLNLDWDQDVPTAQQLKWNSFFHSLIKADMFQIPRDVGYSNDSSVQLHCFVDASRAAYAAVVYQRIESPNHVKSILLFAKVKVSPAKKELTIPKLELTTLSLGCRVLSYVHSQLPYPEASLFVWSDSQCSLHWAKTGATSPVFVKNRVEQIQKTPAVQLRYVPTNSNPADIPTKGLTAHKLSACSLWWNGPDWLTSPHSQWPCQPESLQTTPLVDVTSRTLLQDASCLIGTESLHSPVPVDKFSSLTRLVNTLAWIIRFVDKVRKKTSNSASFITVSETNHSLNKLIIASQRQFAQDYPKEYSDALKQLQLFSDPRGVLRCSGRLDLAEASYDVCFPIFIPRQSAISALIIKQRHEAWGHAGLQHILSDIRSKFWIPQARTMIKSVLQSCSICRRWKGGPYRTPKPPPLPAFRVTQQPSFHTVGVDYLGPLMIRSGIQETMKIWICLFTCCATRAIHLEVVSDMTTNSFLLCFRRFVAHRGPPALIVADNAKNFHLASKVTDALWKSSISNDSVAEFSSQRGIDWKFIVELAPWMGGMYERMVALVKRALKCMVHNSILTLCELQTVCAEVAAILNARPLTYCEDQIGFRSLTPNDLQARRKDTLPLTEENSDPNYELKSTARSELILKWKRLDARLNQFWKMWYRDYLASLRERSWHPNTYGSTRIVPTVGTVVLVGDNGIPRGQWLLGRIEKLCRSDVDGAVRSLIVRTAKGTTLHRPVKLIYPLEVQNAVVSRDDGQVEAEIAEQGSPSGKPKDSPSSKGPEPAAARPKRKAAQAARKRWQSEQEDEENS